VAGFDLSAWPPSRIEEECAHAYRRYHRSLRQQHISFFRQYSDLRDPQRSFCAKSFSDALPPGWGARLEKHIPLEKRHRWCVAGGSSQALALGLLGPAALWGHGLEWLFGPNSPLPSIGDPVAWQFEYEVGFGLLNERPHTTDIDFFASGPRGVAALEAKYMEKEWGRCRCKRRDEGQCDDRILHDRPYWKVAREILGLVGPKPPQHCQLSLAYQAVRNVAAVLEMTDLRAGGSFGLLYDARNPFFAGAGEWPGWANWLQADHAARVVVRAISWQEIIELVPSRGRGDVYRWACKKHGIERLASKSDMSR
jgi:hypothetical protein